jgi:hypothetical protein
MNLGRIVGVIAAVLLSVGAMEFFFFRYAFTAEGLHRVQTAVGVEAPQPERHIVENGFRGWAVLHFGVEGASPLPEDNGVLVVVYPASGRLATSAPAPGDAGFLHREYYRRTENGLEPLSRLGEVWGEYNVPVVTDDRGAETGRSAGFFVGTLAEFRSSDRPSVGPGLPDLPPLQN